MQKQFLKSNKNFLKMLFELFDDLTVYKATLTL